MTPLRFVTCDDEDLESEEESLPEEDEELEDELPLLDVAEELLHENISINHPDLIMSALEKS